MLIMIIKRCLGGCKICFDLTSQESFLHQEQNFIQFLFMRQQNQFFHGSIIRWCKIQKMLVASNKVDLSPHTSLTIYFFSNEFKHFMISLNNMRPLEASFYVRPEKKLLYLVSLNLTSSTPCALETLFAVSNRHFEIWPSTLVVNLYL